MVIPRLAALHEGRAMTQINSSLGSILQTTQVQRQQAAAKDGEAQSAREVIKSIARQDDQYDHTVEGSEEVKRLREERRSDHQRDRKNQRHPQHPADDDERTLDLTA
jgi:hypothetical protein